MNYREFNKKKYTELCTLSDGNLEIEGLSL